MTSVTNKDIARFAAGEITDEVEIARVMEAIRIRPELEDLYFLLSDTDESAAGPDVGNEDAVAWAQMRLQLLRRARLCRFNVNPLLSGRNSPTTVLVQSHLWEHAVECCLTAGTDGGGCYRLSAKLPAGYRLLNLIAAEFNWIANDGLTRVGVHHGWTLRAARPASGNGGTMGSSASTSVVPATLAAESLDARSANSSLPEHTGDTFILTIAGQDARSANVICLDKGVQFPLPVLFSGFLTNGEHLHDARLLRAEHEQFTDLFLEVNGDIRSLEIRPLPLRELSRLAPLDATELLSHQTFAVAAAEPVSGTTDEFTLDLRDEEMAGLLASPNATLCLSLASVETEVQR